MSARRSARRTSTVSASSHALAIGDRDHEPHPRTASGVHVPPSSRSGMAARRPVSSRACVSDAGRAGAFGRAASGSGPWPKATGDQRRVGPCPAYAWRRRAICSAASAAVVGDGYLTPCCRQSAARTFCCSPLGPRARSRASRSTGRNRSRLICAPASAAVFGDAYLIPCRRHSAASSRCCSPVGPRSGSGGFVRRTEKLRSGTPAPSRSAYVLSPRALKPSGFLPVLRRWPLIRRASSREARTPLKLSRP